MLFILGYEHTTYYLTVLIILFLLFWIVKSDIGIYILCIISVISIVSTGWETGINFINTISGTYYLNPLNWTLFFGMGILLYRKTKWLKFFISFSENIYIWLACSLIYFISCYIMDQPIYYFGKWAIIQHIINILLLVGIAAGLNNSRLVGIMARIGGVSFSIYLLHQFIAGAIVAIMNRFPLAICVMIRPILIVSISLAGIRLINKIVNASDGKLDFMRQLVGIRI